MPNEKSYVYSLISFAVAAFFLLMCFLLLATIVIAPAKFVMCFSLAMLSCIVGLAFLNGPRIYVKKLFMAKNLVASCVLIASILLSLWFSMIEESYIWSFLFCFMQLNAILFYFCNTSAATVSTMKWMGNGMWNAIKSLFSRV
jgi:hypothetical protein